MFNRQGQATINYQGGFRNLLRSLETLDFSYEKTLSDLSLSNINGSVKFPFLLGDNSGVTLSTNQASRNIDLRVNERKRSFGCFVSGENSPNGYGVSAELRDNFFDVTNSSEWVMAKEACPSRVLKFKHMNFLWDTIRPMDQGNPRLGSVGQKLRIDNEVTVGDSWFYKCELWHNFCCPVFPTLVGKVIEASQQNVQGNDPAGQEEKPPAKVDPNEKWAGIGFKNSFYAGYIHRLKLLDDQFGFGY